MARDRSCRAWSVGFAPDERCHGAPHVHHRILKGMGGTSLPAIHDADNLMVLCDWHHHLAHNTRRSEAEAASVIIRKSYA